MNVCRHSLRLLLFSFVLCMALLWFIQLSLSHLCEICVRSALFYLCWIGRHFNWCRHSALHLVAAGFEAASLISYSLVPSKPQAHSAQPSDRDPGSGAGDTPEAELSSSKHFFRAELVQKLEKPVFSSCYDPYNSAVYSETLHLINLITVLWSFPRWPLHLPMQKSSESQM